MAVGAGGSKDLVSGKRCCEEVRQRPGIWTRAMVCKEPSDVDQQVSGVIWRVKA